MGMQLAILGRSESLLASAEYALHRGHEIRVVWTNRAEPIYLATEKDFEHLADRCGAVFKCDVAINNRAGTEMLAGFGCDAALSMNYLTLLKPHVLDCFRLGVLNAHVGDLPRYRGNACPNWAILNGESHVAISIHLMTKQLDAGPLLVKSYMTLDDECYITDVYDWIRESTPNLLVNAAEHLDVGVLTPTPQTSDSRDILRTFPRRPEDSRLDWRWETNRVLRMVRASSHPFSGAFCYLEGARRVVVWRAERYVYATKFLAVPGQVCMRDKGCPVIACSDGMIRLTDFEVDGVVGVERAAKILAGSLRNRLK